MKQRIVVRALIKKDGKVLLIKRLSTQKDVIGKYDLPGGRINDGEQPEEALARHIKESTGLAVKVFHLTDVLTYVDEDDRDVQYTVVAYTVGMSDAKVDIRLGSQYSRYAWERLSDVKHEDTTGLAQLLLTMQEDKPATSVDSSIPQSDVIYSTKRQDGLMLYSDGGSRGNPGPSAAGYVVIGLDDQLLYEGGAYLGITTNNQAEYHGVRLGLEKAKELGAKSVACNIDSMLVVNQLNGLYAVKNRELWPIHERIKELIGQFEKVTFRHVRREFNQKADGMVNKILDAHGEKKV